jgi:hypothetical protein
MTEPGEDVRLLWIFVERSMRCFYLEWHGLLAFDDGPEARHLLSKNSDFQKRFKFLRERGLFTDEEIAAVKTFQHERNKASHDSPGLDMLKTFLDDNEIKRLSDSGNKAFNAVEDARERRVFSDCETGREFFLAQVS